MACLPPYLAWRGVPAWPELVVFLCLAGPVFAAILLARTGLLATAHALSAAALAALVALVAGASGGLASPALIWLVAPPLEALLCAGRRGTLAVSAVMSGGLLLVAAADVTGFDAALGAWPLAAAMPLLAIAAIAYAAAHGFVAARERMLQQSERRTRQARERSLSDAIEDLVTWHDRNGHVLDASGDAARLFGAPPESLRGRALFARVHVSDRPAFLKALSDAATSLVPVTVRFRIHVPEQAIGAGAPRTGADVRVIWAEMRVSRVDSAGDSDICAVAVTRDISGTAHQLEELEAARADAVRADAAKGQFLAMVSHELRTPLNAIIGFSEVLAGEGGAVEPERRTEYLRIIHDSGEHLLQVVNTLLDLSKIEAGQFDVLAEPFAIGPFIHGCCDLVGLKAERAGVLLARDIAEDLPELVADRRACKQMIINLLANAIKFTPPGGRVTLSVRRERDRVVFVVCDTGIGIAEEHLPKLGSPFFQVRSDYDRRHEGTGLGLSVVRGLVGLHRGALTLESAPDEGTAVTISLPIDCRAPPSRKAAPVRIHALPRARAPVRALKAG
jgi:two-component system, cell cycle sensor histidine kinase DivJ